MTENSIIPTLARHRKQTSRGKRHRNKSRLFGRMMTDSTTYFDHIYHTMIWYSLSTGRTGLFTAMEHKLAQVVSVNSRHALFKSVIS